MAVRLREADNIAAMAELQQQISELEIQVKSQRALPATSVCDITLRLCIHLSNHVNQRLELPSPSEIVLCLRAEWRWFQMVQYFTFVQTRSRASSVHLMKGADWTQEATVRQECEPLRLCVVKSCLDWRWWHWFLFSSQNSTYHKTLWCLTERIWWLLMSVFVFFVFSSCCQGDTSVDQIPSCPASFGPESAAELTINFKMNTADFWILASGTMSRPSVHQSERAAG